MYSKRFFCGVKDRTDGSRRWPQLFGDKNNPRGEAAKNDYPVFAEVSTLGPFHTCAQMIPWRILSCRQSLRLGELQVSSG